MIGTLVIGSITVAMAQPLAVEFEPHHHPVLQNAAARVLDVRLQPGEASLEHLHAHDVALICLSGSARTRPSGGEWTAVPEPCKAGASRIIEYTANPATHTIQNAGRTPYRLIAVENLRQSGWSTYLPIDGPEVIMERKAFRIYQVVLARGEEVRHTHKVPTVAILISGEIAAGQGTQRSAGDCIFVPAGEPHEFAATNPGQARIIEVEIR